MEEDLDEIAGGRKEYAKTLSEFYRPFHKEIEEKESLPKVTTLGEADKNMPCPICGSKMVVKLSRSGLFLSCANFPACIG